MNYRKYINSFVASLFFLPVIGGLQVRQTVNIATPSSTAASEESSEPGKFNLIQKFQMIESTLTNKRGELRNVEVTAKGTASITVDVDGTPVKVNIQSNTHFRRRFWGKSSLAEITVGDKVDVIGRWANEEKTEVNAVLIRNLSVQKRLGVFFGTVKSITDTGFVMTTIHKGDETVVIDTSTKLINRVEKSILKTDILVGQRIRVRGLWDSKNFTITEVTEIKDFGLPVQGTPSASPLPTATPTP